VIFIATCSLGGSISPATVAEIINRTGRANSVSLDAITQKMTCNKTNMGFKAFLEKFAILNEIPWPDWAIGLSIAQVCDDIKAAGIDYSEISLSIGKYLTPNRQPASVIQYIGELFEIHSKRNGIEVGLLLSLQYHSPRDLQLMHAHLIDNSKIRETFCGLDLIGDENYFDAKFYKPIFEKWRSYGIRTLRAHVGEMPGTGNNVRIAIEELGATRIAHGIQADNDVFKLAAERQVCFDLALHSNLVTGAWVDLHNHPIKRMLQLGCLVTLNTDDPIQFGCTLDDEFDLAIANGLIDASTALKIKHNARIASSSSCIAFSNP